MYFYHYPPGAILRAKSPGISPDHWGIAGRIRPDGTQEIAHSRPPWGVHVTSLGEYALGRSIEFEPPYCPEHGCDVSERAYSQVGRPFNLLFANCEHFATWAFSGMAESQQLRQYAGGLAVAGLVLSALTTGRGENHRRG